MNIFSAELFLQYEDSGTRKTTKQERRIRKLKAINKLQKDVVIFTTNTSIILEGQDQPGMVINAGLTYWHNTCFSCGEYLKNL